MTFTQKYNIVKKAATLFIKTHHCPLDLDDLVNEVWLAGKAFELNEPGLVFNKAIQSIISFHRTCQQCYRICDLEPPKKTSCQGHKMVDLRDEIDFLKRTIMPDELELLFIRFWCGASWSELAANLQVDETTVSRRAMLALDQMRQHAAY